MQKQNVICEQLTECFYRITINYGLRPNIGVFISNEGVLLIDSGHKAVADVLKHELTKLSEQPVKCIINTHLHGDHISANMDFPEVLKHVNFRNHSLYSKQTGAPFELKTGLTQEKIISSFFQFDFYETSFVLMPVEGIHSKDDLIIYNPDNDVVHMGDLLLTESFPAIRFQIPKYLLLLEEILNIFPKKTLFVGGHGKTLAKDGVKNYLNFILETLDIVLPLLKNGKSPAEVRRLNLLKKFEKMGEYVRFLNKDSWVEYIYQSYSSKYTIPD